MTDPTAMTASDVAEAHATEAHAPYLTVWAALAVLTGIEYFYAYFLKDSFLILVLGLLFWALIKAGLVGWYFMHLKFEGNWVYILIVPAFVLATVVVMALMPDMAMKPEEEETPGAESSFVVPAAKHWGDENSGLTVGEARFRDGCFCCARTNDGASARSLSPPCEGGGTDRRS